MFPLDACQIAECDVQMITGMISRTYDDVIIRCRRTQSRTKFNRLSASKPRASAMGCLIAVIPSSIDSAYSKQTTIARFSSNNLL